MSGRSSSIPRFSLAIVLALLVALAVGGGRPAQAADFTVTKTADTADGTCNADCSLREAIIAANALAGPDTITLPANANPYTLTIGGPGEDASATGDLDITDDLTITGGGAAGTIIDGGGIDRVFHIDPENAGVTVEISALTVRNGGGPDGGAAEISSAATLTLNSVTLRDNFGDDGGAIENDGTLTVNDSTIRDNSVEGLDDGGGIRNSGTLTLNNTTISGNVSEDDGGGIKNRGTLSLNNSTVTDNTAEDDGGGIDNSGTATLTNTIVANNPDGGDCDGTITSNGNNIDSDGTCGLAAAGDLSSTDPNLGPLADNGGPTQTHALLSGSPAIDAGDNAACLATDQRGVARPLDGDEDGTAICDIGAYEFEPPDADGDGIPDALDDCPDDPEDFDGFEDADGCPDPDPTPTPTATPAATPKPTATPTATVTATPTPPPAVLAEVEAPSALPDTGGEPAPDGGRSLPLALIAAAFVLAGTGGTLLAVRRRR